MTVGYQVAGRGDLDALFAARVSAAVAATGFKDSAAVDLNSRYEPRGATTAIADTGFRIAGGTDLAQIFKGITSDAITITNITISAVANLANAIAVYTLENDGDVVGTIPGTTGTSEDKGDWIAPKASAPGAYEVRATLSSGGPLTGGTTGTWLPLTSNQSWSLLRPIPGAATAALLIEIRLGGTTLGTCTVTLNATRN